METPSNQITARRVYDKEKRQSKFIKQDILGEDDHNLNLYITPDSDTITLAELHELGRRRMEILNKIENLKEQYAPNPSLYGQQCETHLRAMAKDFLPFPKSNDNVNQLRKNDRISHFFLRLAFSQTTEKTEWFVRQELELFKYRFSIESIDGIHDFFQLNNINILQAYPDEKAALQFDLSQALEISFAEVPATNIYKIAFTDVFEFLHSYKLYLHKGQAYIKSEDLVATVAPQFREILTSSMAHARKHMEEFNIREEQRLVPIVRHLTNRGAVYSKDFKDKAVDDILPRMVDELAKTSFPLCMRSIHNQLRNEHHLRHYARRQYGLFLKGIGMSLNSSLEFFRQEFTKRIDPDKFAKEYTYNIRYIYGLEGKRQDQQPHSCASIILGSAPASGAGDCHGCPYKHLDKKVLSKKLEDIGIRGDRLKNIIDLSNSNRFDVACTRYFESVHNIPENGLGMLITHPNQYYSQSRKIISGEISRDVSSYSQTLTFDSSSQQSQTPILSENAEELF